MSEYKKRVAEEARTFHEKIREEFAADSGEHGGKSDRPNLSKWLDENRKLFTHLDETTKDWGKGEIEEVKAGTRNFLAYGDPKQNAYFAFHKDVLAELKKRAKK